LLINTLRLSGIRVDTDYTGASLKSQMKKADKSGASYTLILGEQEMKDGKAILRNMQTKEQTEVPLQTITEELTAKFLESK
jgi:histidyl-tRNA synthetase